MIFPRACLLIAGVILVSRAALEGLYVDVAIYVLLAGALWVALDCIYAEEPEPRKRRV